MSLMALLTGLAANATSVVTAAEAAAYADQAVAALRDAVQAGWGKVAELRESDFDGLRGRGDFQTLVAEVEAKGEKVSVPSPPPREKK